MNNYNYQKFPISRFFIKLIIIILLLFLIAWLFYKNNNHKTNTNKSNSAEISEKLLSDNLVMIKKAALKYYDEKRVSNITDNKYRISLNTLYKKKLIKNLNDTKNNQCDLNNSYITLAKDNEKYIMKIYLLCNFSSDSISIQLTTNENCGTYLCETTKKIDETKSESELEIKNLNQDDETTNNTNSSTKTLTKKKIKTYKGNIDIKDITNNNYFYEYLKTIDIKYSDWSNWSYYKDISCNETIKNCDNNHVCLTEEKILPYQDKIKYSTNKVSLNKITTQNVSVCNDGYYILNNNTLYKTNSDYSNLNNWKYIGNNLYSIPPKDTLNIKYVYKNIDYRNCGNICSGRQLYSFDKYVFNDTLVPTSNCINSINKFVDVYSYVNELIENSRLETSNTKCYKVIRNRTIIDKGQSIWSNYDNKYLLNNNYIYSGNKIVNN